MKNVWLVFLANCIALAYLLAFLAVVGAFYAASTTLAEFWLLMPPSRSWIVGAVAAFVSAATLRTFAELTLKKADQEDDENAKTKRPRTGGW